MSNDFTFGLHGAIEPNITFIGGEAIEVMRLDKNGVTINPEMPLDEAAQHVINALDAHTKSLIQAEREACAKVVEGLFDDPNDAVLEFIVDAIRARGNT